MSETKLAEKARSLAAEARTVQAAPLLQRPALAGKLAEGVAAFLVEMAERLERIEGGTANAAC